MAFEIGVIYYEHQLGTGRLVRYQEHRERRNKEQRSQHALRDPEARADAMYGDIRQFHRLEIPRR